MRTTQVKTGCAGDRFASVQFLQHLKGVDRMAR